MQESFACIAKDLAGTLGYDPETVRTVVLTANNENGAQARETGAVNFSMNAREVYRTFLRSGVDVKRMEPSDALKLAVDPDLIYGAVTGPVEFRYDTAPEILKIDGKCIAVAHNLGQSSALLEEVRNGTSRYDIIRLTA